MATAAANTNAPPTRIELPVKCDVIDDCTIPVDVVLQSADGKLMGAHKKNLEFFTEAFPQDGATTQSPDDIVSLTEKSETLRLFLRFTHNYPAPDLSLLSIDDLLDLAEAGNKYGNYFALAACRNPMRALAQASPRNALRVLCFKLICNDLEGIDEIAPCTLFISILGAMETFKDHPREFMVWVKYQQKYESAITSFRKDLSSDPQGHSHHNWKACSIAHSAAAAVRSNAILKPTDRPLPSMESFNTAVLSATQSRGTFFSFTLLLMISLSTVLYLSTIVTGVAFAKPTLSNRQTQTCTPNFSTSDPFDWNNSENLGFSDGVKSGSGILKTQPLGLFKFTKVNSSPPSFYIQSFENQNLAVGLRSNNSLFLTDNKFDGNTKFIIECGDCGNSVNDNCFMKLADKPDQCVQVGKNSPLRGSDGDAVFVTAPCRRDDSQRFNYFQRPLPPTPIIPATPPQNPNPPPQNPNPPSNSPSQGVCNPNFEFEGVRVANSAIYWGAPSFANNVDLAGEGSFDKRLEIRFEQTGSPNPYYVAKSLNGTNLAVAVRTNGNLYFVDNLDTSNARHRFQIECKAFCRGATTVAPGDLSADGCTIKSAFDNKCVQLGNGPSAGSQGDRIFVNNCDGTDSQRFNFLTSPFKQSGRATFASSSSGAGAKGNVAAAAIGESDSVNLDVKQLIMNSYIVIGLLAGILVAMVVMGVLASKGCFKGRDSKPRYSFITGSNLKETEALTSPTRGRYSD
ncbi:hypothetical protein V5O48_012138 [Marasmius crinis-equi]|uniref:BTB domain-containing protein n=1 Tax=Marasmius crinis-equi TaxID=585013 RepID=A0ABR3F3L9_9AGAR